jgi:RNA polymerase sigma-70 factor (ECF subfamily)
LADNTLSTEDVKRLYERHGRALVVYACSYTNDAARAEDAVHSVFHRLLRSSIAVPENPAGYLYRAVRNTALNVRRDGARETPLDESCFVHRDGHREAALALQKALSELPEDQREVVTMRIWGGMTLNEAAAASGVPLHTAASRYRYALAKLRETLQPYCAAEGRKNSHDRSR